MNGFGTPTLINIYGNEYEFVENYKGTIYYRAGTWNNDGMVCTFEDEYHRTGFNSITEAKIYFCYNEFVHAKQKEIIEKTGYLPSFEYLKNCLLQKINNYASTLTTHQLARFEMKRQASTTEFQRLLLEIWEKTPLNTK